MAKKKKKPAPRVLQTEEGQAAHKAPDTDSKAPKQGSAKPSSYIQLNSRITHQLHTVNKGRLKPIYAWGKRDDSPKVYVTLEYDEKLPEAQQKLTQADLDVLGAVCSLWYYRLTDDKLVVSTRQIWAALTGSDENPGAAQLMRLEKKLDKIRETKGKLNINEEIAAARKPLAFEGDPLQGTLEGAMLCADKVVFKKQNGRTVSGYIIYRPPIMFQHDMSVGQIISMPRPVLKEASRANRNSERNLLIRNYLYRRIVQRDRKNPNERFINYESVYKAAGISNPTKQQAKSMRRVVGNYMTAFRKSGVCFKWKTYQSNRDKAKNRLTGVHVFLKPDKPHGKRQPNLRE